MKWEGFDKYLSNEEKLGECVQNYEKKRTVYKEKINEEIFYIKKYTLRKKESFLSNLKIKSDPAMHYKEISDELNKINILHVLPEYINVRSESLFQRTVILVMKDGGIPLNEYISNYEEKLDLFNEFFNIFIKLCKNRIYSRDYNLEGALIGKDRNIRLIDFDKYRIKKNINKRFKRKIIDNLRKSYIKKNRKKEFEEFLKMEISRVIKELEWENDIK